MADITADADGRSAGFCTTLVLFLLSAVFPALFILGFSGMGYGLDVATGSISYHDEAAKVIYGSLAYMAFMFIFDSHFWPIPLRILSWFAIFVAFSLSMCVLFTEIPYGPISVFTVLMPLFLLGIRAVFYSSVPTHVYAGWIHGVLVSIASITLAGFFYWNTKAENMWDSETNASYSSAVGCKVDYTDLDECRHPTLDIPCFFSDETMEEVIFSAACRKQCLDVYQACEEAFIIWSNPGLASMTLFVLGFISKYLRNPNDPQANIQIASVVKIGTGFLFVFWIYASLIGAGEGLSSSLIAFAISLVIGSSIVITSVFWTNLTTSSGEYVGGAAKQAEAYLDIFKGLLILGFTPLVLAYLVVSMANQFVRRHFTRHCCKKRMSDEEREHSGCVTLAAANQIQDFKGWDHTRVLSIAVYWGIGYVFLNVLASKFTTVFLSWLIEYTSTMSIPAVTGIVLAVGMFLFMLPPIPGLPIYLTGGIVLVSIGKDTMGLWGAVTYACAVSLVVKLLACAVQQKLIGGTLGGNVGVKQMVSMNSEGIRAMRVMLSDEGFTARKVAVLVGGPDWPVSVLCGILGLDLGPILIGTFPVVVLIVPAVLTGSFAYMGSLENDKGQDMYPWADTMGAVVSALTAGSMFFFTLSAANAIKETLAKDGDTIASIPMDEAVAKADAEAEKNQIVNRRVTAWSGVPFFMKLVLIFAVLAMMGCCYLLVLFNSQCFREYDLMYTIGEHLGGQWTNIVMPLGRIALLLFIISYGLHYAFQSWATVKTNAAMDEMDDAEIIALTSTKVATYA
uniref:Uncharacterized protein n=1 Tax=Odontella aurita TaxID=265563 RepID=A0A7S4M5X6_9STRA